MIDTHCHLTFPEFAHDPGAVIAEASGAGVTGMITISTTTRDCVEALAIARAHERVWCTAGVHPCYADQGPHDWDAARRVIEDPKCVAWGELGLDNFHPRPARSVQDAVLVEQLALIRSCRDERGIDKPVVLHCREAFDDLLPVLRECGLAGERFVFHCFTASEREMKMVLDFGAMVSFTGVVTYANAPELRSAARLVPADRFMVETDAPYLSPEPVRKSRPCRPAYVRHTLEALASLRGVRTEDLHQQINANTRRFFGIDAR